MGQTTRVNNPDLHPVSRRDALEILFASLVFPSLSVAQDPPKGSSLSGIDPATREHLVNNLLGYKLAQLPNENVRTIGALLEIGEVSKNVDNGLLGRDAANKKIEQIIAANAHASPATFASIPWLLKVDKSEKFIDDGIINFGSAGFNVGVITAGAMGAVSPAALIGLQVAGALLPPTLHMANKKDPARFPPPPTKEQFKAVNDFVLRRAAEVAGVGGYFKTAVTSDSFVKQFKLNFAPGDAELRNGVRPAVRKALDRVVATARLSPKERQAAVALLKSQLNAEVEKLRELAGEAKTLNRARAAKEAREQFLEKINFEVGEIQGLGQIMGVLADKAVGDPVAGKALMASSAAVSQMYRLGSLFELGQIGAFAFSSGLVGIVGGFFGAFESKSDELILKSLAHLHEKVDEVLKSTYRIEKAQVAVLHGLKVLLGQMAEFRAETRVTLAQLQDQVKRLLNDVGEIERDKDNAEFQKQILNARSLLKISDDKRDGIWNESMRRVLIDFVSFGDIVSRKSVFAGRSEQAADLKSLQLEGVRRRSLDLVIGLLPQISMMISKPEPESIMAKYLAEGAPSLPNPNLWAASTDAYLQTRVASMRPAAKDDQEHLVQLWNAGIDLRRACMHVSDPAFVAKTCKLFLQSTGALKPAEPIEAKSNPVPKPPEKTIEKALARWYPVEPPKVWTTGEGLIGAVYVKINDFAKALAQYIRTSSLSPQEQWAKTRKDGNESTVIIGQLYYSIHPYPPDYRGNKQNLPRFWITNDPLDLALALGAIKAEIVSEHKLTKQLKFTKNFGTDAGTALFDGKVITEVTGPVVKDVVETSPPNVKDPFVKYRHFDDYADVRPMLDTCQKLIRECIAHKIKTELATELAQNFSKIEMHNIEGAALVLKAVALLVRARSQEAGASLTPKLRFADMDGIYSGEAIVEFLTDRLKNYNGKIEDVAFSVTSDLYGELNLQCDLILLDANSAPSDRSLPVVDDTLRRLAGFMIGHGVAFPETKQ